MIAVELPQIKKLWRSIMRKKQLEMEPNDTAQNVTFF